MVITMGFFNRKLRFYYFNEYNNGGNWAKTRIRYKYSLFMIVITLETNSNI